jgi:spore coat polysaccharide biosynthesis protein SpsF
MADENFRNPRAAPDARIVGILQARMSSSRLPGKVLKQVQGKSCLAHQMARVSRSKLLEKVVIATTDQPDDDAIEEECKKIGVECFRGDLNNVLDRFYQCAKKENLKPTDVVCRLTGDCPLHDAEIIDGGIQLYLSTDCDLAGSHVPDTFPDGQQCEVFSMANLERAHAEATTTLQLEHVTPYINMQPHLFKLEGYECKPCKKHFRWTIDEPEDYTFVCAVYDALYPDNPNFTTADIEKLLEEQPDLYKINAMHLTDAGALEGLRAGAIKRGENSAEDFHFDKDGTVEMKQ